MEETLLTNSITIDSHVRIYCGDPQHECSFYTQSRLAVSSLSGADEYFDRRMTRFGLVGE